MIEIKSAPFIPAGSFKETTITIDSATLNDNIPVYNFAWDNSIVIYMTIQNNTDVNFNYILLNDLNNDFLVHQVGTHSGSYSIVFAGDQIGQPNISTKLINLLSLTLQWTFPGGNANGDLVVKIYSQTI